MKLSENPFKSEYKLKQHLDSDHVEIPGFPKKVSRFDRLIRFLGYSERSCGGDDWE